MRSSSTIPLLLSAAGALLVLTACNERAPEKTQGVADSGVVSAPHAQAQAQPPASATPSPDTLTPANPPPGDAAPAPTPPTLPPDPGAPVPNDPSDPTTPPVPPHGG